MAKPNHAPRISVNKLGEYMVSKPRRQTQILYDQKFPADYITMYYRDAQEAIAHFVANNMEDISILERQIQVLDQKSANKVYETRRIAANIEAIESFMGMLDDVDLNGAVPRLGEHAPPKLMVRNVEISVRPEVVLAGQGKKSGALVGGIKLHFPKAFPLTEDAAGYISAATQAYCNTHLSGEGISYAPYCSVIDIAARRVWTGIRSTKQRMRDIEAACDHIAAIWPTIRPPSN